MKRKELFAGFLVGVATTFMVVTILICLNLLQPNIQTNIGNLENNKSAQTSTTTTSAIIKKLNVLTEIINSKFYEDVDAEKMTEGLYKGLLKSLDDPYSRYYTKEEYKDMMESTNGIYSGIGASVNQNIKTNIMTIVKPFENGPAYKAGMLPGDVLYKVDGKDITDMELSDVVALMKGEEGTKVTVTVVRDGEKNPIDFTMIRAKIETPTIEYKMLEDNIGYISVSAFDGVTAPQYRAALEELEKQGMEGLVVDLRNNPGGRLETVCDMLDRMLPEGLIVYQEDKTGKRSDEVRSTAKEQFKKPLAVIVNGNSASASEVFAGAIQDYGIGTIVGTTSFGKGIVQSIIPLTDGTAVKVTISKYFTPNGRNIHGKGIEPDVKVDLPDEVKKKITIEYKEDTQLQKAVEVVKDKMK